MLERFEMDLPTDAESTRTNSVTNKDILRRMVKNINVS